MNENFRYSNQSVYYNVSSKNSYAIMMIYSSNF